MKNITKIVAVLVLCVLPVCHAEDLKSDPEIQKRISARIKKINDRLDGVVEELAELRKVYGEDGTIDKSLKSIDVSGRVHAKLDDSTPESPPE